MYLVEIESVAIVVSDIHLGASKVEIMLFKDFLEGIIRNISKTNIKALIIDGDFFDIVMMSYGEITNTYGEIFGLLEIIKRLDIVLVFTLGNHEILVTGRRECLFKKRKERLIDKFKAAGFNYSFLDYGNFCQYVLLRKNESNKNLELFLLDSIKQLKKRRLRRIIPKILMPAVFKEASTRDEDFHCLITHGYQFEPWWVLFFAGNFGWGPFIKTDSSTLKAGMDFFWNYILHGRKNISGLTEEDIDKLLEGLDLPHKFKKKLRRKLRRILKWEENRHKNKNKRYYLKISKFFKKNKFHSINNKISHIIFGHSHKPEKKFKGGNNRCIIMTNSGSWHKILKPSFVEINLVGKKKINLNVKRYKLTKDLGLLKTIYSCINYLIGESKITLINNSPDKYPEILSYSTDKIFNIAKDLKIISNNQFNLLGKYCKLILQPRIKIIPMIKKEARPQKEDISIIKNILETIIGNKNFLIPQQKG